MLDDAARGAPAWSSRNDRQFRQRRLVLLPRDRVNDDFVEAPEMQGARRKHIRRYVTDEQRSSSGWIGEIVEPISREEH